MPAKYSPKVKLELLTTLECQSSVNYVYLGLSGYWGFYNGKGLTSFPRCRILFLIRFYANIFYKTLSLQESLGSTWNVGLKIFPYTSFLAIHARNMLVPLASTRQLYLVSLTSSALLLRWPLTHTLTMMFLSILVWTCPFGIDCKAINEFISYHKIVNLGPGR